jgi:putative transposase
MSDLSTRAPEAADPIRRLLESMREKCCEALEDLLKEEINEALGALRYKRTEGRGGYRNGSYERQVVTAGGEATIAMPRAVVKDEAGAWVEHRSKVLPAGARRIPAIDAVILGAYLGGMNTRKIRRALEPLLGASALSKSAISRVVVKLKDRFGEWMMRDLSGEVVVRLYLDAMMLPVRIARRVVRVPVQAVIGVRADGQKVLLSLRVAPSESTMSWKGMIEDLVARGLRAPTVVIVDGNPGLLRAIREHWGKSDIQRCTKHKWENIKAAAPKHCHGELKRDYDAIVRAKDLAAAQKAYDAFTRKWSRLCEGAVKSLHEAGPDLLTFYRYPRSQWKSLRTTNPIERLNEEFRRRTKTQGSFGNESSALVLLWGLIAFGHVRLNRISGWKEMKRLNEAA